MLYALDRDTFVETLLSGLTGRADFFLHPDEPAYRLAEQRGLNRFLFDPTRAERLLAEAGWTRGPDRMFRNSAGQPIHIDVTSSAQGANVQEAQTVASNWSTAGFQSAPTPYPAGADNATEIRHKSPGALIWPYNFSQTVIKTFTTPEIGTDTNRWRGGNYGGYVNPTYERLYDELVNTFEANARAETTFQLLRILNEQLPALPIFFTPLAVIARKGVEGPGMT